MHSHIFSHEDMYLTFHFTPTMWALNCGADIETASLCVGPFQVRIWTGLIPNSAAPVKGDWCEHDSHPAYCGKCNSETSVNVTDQGGEK